MKVMRIYELIDYETVVLRLRNTIELQTALSKWHRKIKETNVDKQHASYRTAETTTVKYCMPKKLSKSTIRKSRLQLRQLASCLRLLVAQAFQEALIV